MGLRRHVQGCTDLRVLGFAILTNSGICYCNLSAEEVLNERMMSTS